MSSKSILSVLLIAVLVLPALVVLPAEAQKDSGSYWPTDGWRTSAHGAAQGGDPACESDAGTVVTLSIESEALDEQRSYNLYLPPDWCHLDDLPLLVLLHGGGQDHNEWVNFGHIDAAADELILAGEIDPLVILMPGVGRSYCANGELGNYEDYLVDDLIPAVEEAFPTAAAREQRFVGGVSMGGFCAVYLGPRHPDLFSAVGAYSAAIWRRIDKTIWSVQGMGPPPTHLYGADWQYFEERDPVSLIEANGWPDDVRLFVDVGESDWLVSGIVANFRACLDAHEVTYEGHIWPGEHDWVYWSAHEADYLRFFVGVETSDGS